MEGYLELYNTELTKDIDPLLVGLEDEDLDEIELSYLEKLRRRLKKYLRYLKRTFHVIVTDYLPSFVLGMTDCKGNIWIRRMCGYLKEHVLKHEIIHNLFSYLDEFRVEMLNRAGYISNLSNFNLIYSR